MFDKKKYKREYMREWRKIPKNAEDDRQRCRVYRSKNIEELNQKSKVYRKRVRLEILNHYSGNDIKCGCCGEKELDFLALDHINNDGSEHRRKNKIKGGLEVYGWIRRNNYPPIFQILCMNCNFSKKLHNQCIHNIRRNKST